MVKKISYLLLAVILLASFLRLWRLDQVPTSLFGDELDVGYHAYSILKTGKDYSGNFMPIQFQSLAEWRTPLYLYSSVPTVAIFGITPWGVRLPAALFGIATIPVFFLLIKELLHNNEKKYASLIALFSSFLLCISPWHIQYSRAAFEVTQLLFFLVLGIYLFLRAMRLKGNHLWLSAICFALLPSIYSTAKLFTPMILVVLFVLYRKSIVALPKKAIVISVIALGLVVAPILWSTLFSGGAQRFNYISVFSDPTTEPEIGTARGADAHSRGETGTGLNPTIVDRLFHNKITLWGDTVVRNYLTPFSSEYLFNSGDPNPRHSIEGMGVFYKFELVGLLAGLVFFLTKSADRNKKLLIAAWVLLGVFPSSLTRDGGNHSTRLILTLPPLIFLISYGFYYLYIRTRMKLRFLTVGAYVVVLAFSFVSYQHLYWVHNPSQSERWWHYGWGEAISSMKEIESQYENVVITSRDEPPWIFFAAWYQFDPATWHKGYPMQKHTIEGFGEVSYIGKFSFGSPNAGLGVYDWGKVLKANTLYVASAKEVNVNLILEPERTPNDLKLIKAIPYPSGEPAFYLFTLK